MKASDIRLDVGFFGHKAKKLKRLLGAEAVLCLIRLWCWVAVNKPDGVLTNLDAFDIADNAEWHGDAEEFVNTLVAIKYLDLDDDEVYSVHDWRDHQPFVVKADWREERSRKASYVRWGKNESDTNNGTTDTNIETKEVEETASQPDVESVRDYLSRSKWNAVLNGTDTEDWLADLVNEHGKKKILKVLPDYIEWWDKNMSGPPAIFTMKQRIWKRCAESKIPKSNTKADAETPKSDTKGAWEDFG